MSASWRARYAAASAGTDDASLAAQHALRREAVLGLVADAGRKDCWLSHRDICVSLVEGASLFAPPRPLKGALSDVTASPWASVCVGAPKARPYTDAPAARSPARAPASPPVRAASPRRPA